MATDRLPGIKVEIVDDTGIIAPPLYERYPVYIGVGDPYRKISNYEMTKGTGTTDAIPTVSTVHSIVSVGDLPGISGYIAGTDYSLVGNTVSWIPGGSSPTNGDAYFITYTENRAASAYDPTLYFDEGQVYTDHGNRTRTDGNFNDIANAAHLGFLNGAKGVYIAQLDPTGWVDPESPTNAELETSFIAMKTRLEEIVGYKLFLVPLSSGSLNTTTAADIFFNHAVLCSQPENKQERTAVASLPSGTAYTGFATFAESYDHERMVVPAPKLPVTVAGTTGAPTDTRMAAAALAGRLCSVGIGREISDEIIFGITMDGNYIPAYQKYMRGRGVSVLKQQGTVVRNIMAITTDTTSALTESLGVQDIKDYVKKYWREGLWDVYKNAPINAALLSQVTDSSRNILDKLIEDTVISAWDRIAVSQDTTEPRKLNVSARIQPAYGMQYMDVTFTFVLSM